MRYYPFKLLAKKIIITSILMLGYFSSYSQIQTLKQNNCLSMYDETEGKIPDTHLGINGHNKAADVFLNYINNE